MSKKPKHGPKAVLAGATIALTLVTMVVIAALPEAVGACFGGPSDFGAIEVVLSKPSVEYDFSVLKGLEGVTILDGGVAAFKSHVSGNVSVAVLLERVSLGVGAPKYLAVRVQAPVRLVNVTVYEFAWKGSFVVPGEVNLSTIKDVAASLGWSFKEPPEGGGVGGAPSAYLVKRTSNCVVALRTWFSYDPAPRQTRVNASMAGEGSEACVAGEVRALISKVVGHDVDVAVRLVGEHTRSKVEVGVSAEVLKAVLAYELKWLTSVGVIKGLSDADIAAIVNASKPGYAGWNSRLVYANGAWMPYHDALKWIPDSALIRGGCGDLGELLTNTNLSTPAAQGTEPAGAPQQATTTVTTTLTRPPTIDLKAALIAAGLGALAAAAAWVIGKRRGP